MREREGVFGIELNSFIVRSYLKVVLKLNSSPKGRLENIKCKSRESVSSAFQRLEAFHVFVDMFAAQCVQVLSIQVRLDIPSSECNSTSSCCCC